MVNGLQTYYAPNLYHFYQLCNYHGDILTIRINKIDSANKKAVHINPELI